MAKEEKAKKESLSVTHPELAKQWHPFRNGNLTPDAVTLGSGKKAWWRCEKGHEWEATINSRTYMSAGCPICAGRAVLPGYNDLASANPTLASEWHPTKNGDLKPDAITPCSNKKVWWLGKCGHEFEMIIMNRHRKGYGCPICSGQTLLSGFNDLKTRFPEVALEWHATRNGRLTPDMVMSGSHKKVWWLGKCGHEWEAPIYGRTGQNRGCPICANQSILPGTNDLASLFPKIAAEWHPAKNGDLTPSMVGAKSGRKVWWQCEKGHEWEIDIKSRTSGKNCPYCGRRRLLSGFNDLETLSPHIAAEWHPTKNGDLLPSQVMSCTAKKVWWQCPHGHSYQATIANRAWGKGCSVCFAETKTSFPEQAILYYLKQVTDAQSRCIIHGKEVDVWLPNLNTGIEYNGSYWHKNSEEKDKRKLEHLHSFGVRVITVRDGSTNEIHNDSISYIYEPYQRDDLNWAIQSVFHLLGLSAPVIDTEADEANIRKQYVIEERNTSLAALYPEIAAEWHPTKNGELKPTQVKAHSGKKVWWLYKCGHEKEQLISGRTGGGKGCPICGRQQSYITRSRNRALRKADLLSPTP